MRTPPRSISRAWNSRASADLPSPESQWVKSWRQPWSMDVNDRFVFRFFCLKDPPVVALKGIDRLDPPGDKNPPKGLGLSLAEDALFLFGFGARHQRRKPCAEMVLDRKVSLSDWYRQIYIYIYIYTYVNSDVYSSCFAEVS